MNRNSVYTLVCLAALAALLPACRWFDQRHQQPGAAVEINGNYLYRSTLDSLTMGLTGEDSIRVAQQYIGRWAKDILLYERARAKRDARMDALVEDYKRSLYVHAYEEYLVERFMPKAIPDSAVRRFYEMAGDRFILRESIVRGAMVVVVNDAPHLKNLRQAMTDMQIDEIEKYAYGNAKGYELFTDRWLTVSDLLPLLPVERSELENRLRQQTMIEMSDSLCTYLLRVTDKCLRGDRMPFDYARPEIEQILLSDRKVEFLRHERDRLYDEAVVDKKVRFFE